MSNDTQPTQVTRPKYPGMRIGEGEVARRWLGLAESQYDLIEYNVRIGPGRDPGPAYSDYVRKTALVSSQRRIDLIAWKDKQPTLVELKRFAFPDAVQQLALYGAVWQAEHPELPAPRLLLVCLGMDAGVMPTATAAGITVQVV